LDRHSGDFFGEWEVKRTYAAVPRLAERILRILYSQDNYLERSGDLEEVYADWAEKSGFFWAKAWLWFQILRLFYGAIRTNIDWRYTMLKNYFKITLRTIKQHKEYSLINIAGLAMGIACCILILLWVKDELSFDKFNRNVDHLYRIVVELSFEGQTLHVSRTPSAVGPALLEEIPEVINSVRYSKAPSLLVSYAENNFYESGVVFADPSIFEMFTFPFKKGNKDSALENPSSVVISESVAAKYFPRDNPIDKTLRINNKHDFIVRGVIENVPRNSHLKFDILLPFQALENMGEDVGIRWRPVEGNWGINWYFTYVQITEQADIQGLDNKIFNLIAEHSSITSTKLHTQPVKKIHLHSNLVADVEDNGNIKYVQIFSIVAFFVLFIACINFMNLTTAHAARRAKEVGIRKVAGAKRGQIIKQFLGESTFLSIFSLIIAICIVLSVLPVFNNVTGKELSFTSVSSTGILLILILVTLSTGFVAGSYPAFFLSSFQPVTTLRKSGKFGPKSLAFRRFLVVLQFSLSIILIIATLVVHKQLDFIQNSNVGFERDHVVCIRLRGESPQYYDSLKNELLKNPNILSATAANQLPTHILYSITGAHWEGKNPDDNFLFHFVTVDYDFIQTLNLQIVDGRDFSKDFQSDRTEAFILNEKAAEIMGKEYPIGKLFYFFGRKGKIIGIVKNFNFASFYNEIKPLVLLYEPPSSDNYIMIKISGDNISTNLASVEESWNKTIPLYPLEFSFLDEEFNRQYQSEKRMGRLFNIFTFLSIFIASLGLFGLVSFMSNQRTKEIGIRRVIGASALDIVNMLTKEFVILVAVANVIAWPVAYFFMSRWLNTFVFRTNVHIWIFLLSAMAAFVIAFISVSYKTIKAALANPINALRYE
jgi:putative ABC transport system permease protein